jgi:hypothetical protein
MFTLRNVRLVMLIIFPPARQSGGNDDEGKNPNNVAGGLKAYVSTDLKPPSEK